MSIQPRLNRLFAPDGRCFDVAIDHGIFNEWTFLTGNENIAQAVQTVVAAGPDAVQLTPGQAHHLQHVPGKDKPALVMRTDVGNFYGPSLPDHIFSQLIDRPIEQALRLDAACVVVNLLRVPDQPELHHQSVANVCALKPECERYGMPLMVEPLVMQPNEVAGGYMVDGTLEKIIPLARQAVELGADVLKVDPCDDPAEFHRVVEAVHPVPVLVRGGGRVSDEEVLKRTRLVIDQGARGIVYGRNVIQHEHPARMTAALMAVVHDGEAAEEAQALLADPEA